MNTRIQKEVTVTLEMSLDELNVLRGMLHQWRRDIGDRLPDGEDTGQNEFIETINYTYVEAMR
jgi:hypothetical protein